jgi:hypothetical protein
MVTGRLRGRLSRPTTYPEAPRIPPNAAPTRPHGGPGARRATQSEEQNPW